MKNVISCIAFAIMFYIIKNDIEPTWLVIVYWGLVGGYWAVNQGGDKRG